MSSAARYIWLYLYRGHRIIKSTGCIFNEMLCTRGHMSVNTGSDKQTVKSRIHVLQWVKELVLSGERLIEFSNIKTWIQNLATLSRDSKPSLESRAFLIMWASQWHLLSCSGFNSCDIESWDNEKHLKRFPSFKKSPHSNYLRPVFDLLAFANTIIIISLWYYDFII